MISLFRTQSSVVKKITLIVLTIFLMFCGLMLSNSILVLNIKDSLIKMVGNDVVKLNESEHLRQALMFSFKNTQVLLHAFYEPAPAFNALHERTVLNLQELIRRAGNRDPELGATLERYSETLDRTLVLRRRVNQEISNLDETEAALDRTLDDLDQTAVEMQLTPSQFSLEAQKALTQFTIVLPAFHEIYFEMTVAVLKLKNAYLSNRPVSPEADIQVHNLIDEFLTGLQAGTTAWPQIKPRIQELTLLLTHYRQNFKHLHTFLHEYLSQYRMTEQAEEAALEGVRRFNTRTSTHAAATTRLASDMVNSGIRIAMVLSCAILALLLLTGRTAIKLISPLKNLTEGVRRVGGGEFDHRLEAVSHDEFGLLARSFNSMTARLQKTMVSQETLEDLLDSMHESVILLSPTGAVKRANAATLAMLGYTAAEIAGMQIQAILVRDNEKKGSLAPDNSQFDTTSLLSASREGNREVAYRPKSGSPVPVLFSAAPLSHRHKSTQDIVCVALDISGLKRSQEELRRSETFNRSIIESTRDCIKIVSLTGKIEYVNARGCHILGVPDSRSVLHTPLADFWQGTDRQSIQAAVAKALRGQSAQVMLPFVGSSKRVRWCDIVVSPIYRSDKTVEGVLVVSRDITDRKLAEEKIALNEKALIFSERKYRELFNDAPLMYIIIRNDATLTALDEATPTIIEDASRQFLDTLGYTAEEVIGKSLFDFYPHGSPDRLVGEAYRRAIKRGKDALPRQLVAKDGTRIDTLLRALPYNDDAGNTIGTRAMFLDITAYKKIESEKRVLEGQLQHAQKMESIGTLAGGIAHDFNNILGAIIGYSELILLEADGNSKFERYLGNILEAGTRAKELVQQILAFSRQDAKEKRPIAIGPLIKEIGKFLRATLPSTIRLELQLNCEIDIVAADPTQIHQVLMNLCTNAAHAMNESGGVLAIMLNPTTLNETAITTSADLNPSLKPNLNPDLNPGLNPGLSPIPYLEIRVSDSGRGIPPEDLARIFDPYFTTKQKGEGTGLGLSVVHGIIKEHGGEIHVNSEPGKGTEFTVLLPLAEKASASREEIPLSTLPTGSERILLVDDEPALVHSLKKLLEILNYQVVGVSDPAEALALFKTQYRQIDLVITDMTMPQMTGDQLARAMITIKPNIPIIACTGYSDKINRSSIPATEFKGVLMKPVIQAEVARLIRNVFDQCSG